MKARLEGRNQQGKSTLEAYKYYSKRNSSKRRANVSTTVYTLLAASKFFVPPALRYPAFTNTRRPADRSSFRRALGFGTRGARGAIYTGITFSHSTLHLPLQSQLQHWPLPETL
jgi:hypothetical protein